MSFMMSEGRICTLKTELDFMEEREGINWGDKNLGINWQINCYHSFVLTLIEQIEGSSLSLITKFSFLCRMLLFLLHSIGLNFYHKMKDEVYITA